MILKLEHVHLQLQQTLVRSFKGNRVGNHDHLVVVRSTFPSSMISPYPLPIIQSTFQRVDGHLHLFIRLQLGRACVCHCELEIRNGKLIQFERCIRVVFRARIILLTPVRGCKWRTRNLKGGENDMAINGGRVQARVRGQTWTRWRRRTWRRAAWTHYLSGRYVHPRRRFSLKVARAACQQFVYVQSSQTVQTIEHPNRQRCYLVVMKIQGVHVSKTVEHPHGKRRQGCAPQVQSSARATFLSLATRSQECTVRSSEKVAGSPLPRICVTLAGQRGTRRWCLGLRWRIITFGAANHTEHRQHQRRTLRATSGPGESFHVESYSLWISNMGSDDRRPRDQSNRQPLSLHRRSPRR